MNVLMILIPIALGLGLLGLAGFLWALKSGQFEDLEGEAARILFDDSPPEPKKDTPKQDTSQKDTSAKDQDDPGQDSAAPKGG